MPIIFIFCPLVNSPSITLTNTTTPRYESYQLSTNKAFVSLLLLPNGGFNLSISVSKISSIPWPVFAETYIVSYASRPITSSICMATFSGSAAGKSILLITEIISWSTSIA